MCRLVRTGLFLCGASLLLFLISGVSAQAENSAAPALKIAQPHHVKPKPPAHAEHTKALARKVAAIHRKPVHRHLATRARPEPKAPIARSHAIAVARAHPPGESGPIVLASARPGPVEAAEADTLAASLNRPAPAIDRSASDFVTAFLSEAFRVARSADSAPDRRRAELANLMTTRMDLSRILVYATHAAYQSASPEMQQQFRLSFASFLAEAYTPRIKLAAELPFTTADPRRGPDGGIMVSTIFTKPGIAESTIDWQLEPVGNSFRIVDVGSEGVSLLQIQRSSFTSVMANAGGMQGLLAKMDARTRELASAAN
jgi:ABC-type transporter MlaC component